MALTKKKTATPPTPEEKLAAAHAQSAAALSVFEVAARDLEAAASSAIDLAADAGAEAAWLEHIAEEAVKSSDAFATKAAAIRALIG